MATVTLNGVSIISGGSSVSIPVTARTLTLAWSGLDSGADLYFTPLMSHDSTRQSYVNVVGAMGNYVQISVGAGVVSSDINYADTHTSGSVEFYPLPVTGIVDEGWEFRALYYASASSDGVRTSGPYTTTATLTAPGTPTVTQSGSNYHAVFAASSASGGSGNVNYLLQLSTDNFSTYDSVDLGDSLSADVPIAQAQYGTAVGFRVLAQYCGRKAVGGSASYTAREYSGPVVRGWNGTAFAECQARFWDGSAWRKLKVWNGSSWEEVT